MQAHDKAIIHGSGQSRWRTPPALFQRLSTVMGEFLIDAAAGPEDHLCDYWFGPGADDAEIGCARAVCLTDPHDPRRGSWADGLALNWFDALAYCKDRDGIQWIFWNPPYSKEEIAALKKAGAPADDVRIRALK